MRLFPRLPYHPSVSNTFLLLSIVTLSVALVGCGGPSIRYQDQSVTYEKIPRKRPAGATTFAIEAQGEGSVPSEKFAIRGMQPAADKPDLVVRLKPGKASWDEVPNISTNERLDYGGIPGPDGKEVDGTNNKYYSKAGYTEQVASNPIVTITHIGTGKLTVPYIVEIIDTRSGATVEVKDLTQSPSVILGRAPESSFLSYSASIETGSTERSVTNVDDGSNVYQDVRQLARGVVTLRAAKQGAAAFAEAARNGRTPAKDLMMSRWNPTCAVRANYVQISAENALAAWLENDYAGGPTEFHFTFGDLDGEPSFPAIRARFDQLLSSATAGRESLAQGIVTDLGAIVANTQLDLRPRAVASYDCAVVYVVIGNLDKARGAAQAAKILNAQEGDGFFGSSGKDLTDRITALIAHITDRRSRLPR